MSNYATKDDVQEIVAKTVDKAVEDLSEIIANFAQQVDERFNHLEVRQDKLEKKFDRLLNTIDGFISRIEAARDSQFEKLLSWARKVSEKTGIPLENL